MLNWLIISSSFSYLLTLSQGPSLSFSSSISTLPPPFLSTLLPQGLPICLLLLTLRSFLQQSQHQGYIPLRICKLVAHLITHLIIHLLNHPHYLLIILQRLQLKQFCLVSFQGGSTFLQLFISLPQWLLIHHLLLHHLRSNRKTQFWCLSTLKVCLPITQFYLCYQL